MTKEKALSMAWAAIYTIVEPNVPMIRDKLHSKVETPRQRAMLTVALDSVLQDLFVRSDDDSF